MEKLLRRRQYPLSRAVATNEGIYARKVLEIPSRKAALTPLLGFFFEKALPTVDKKETMRYNNDNGKGATTIVAFAFFRFFSSGLLDEFQQRSKIL